MFNLGMPELVVILVIALIILGPGKLPTVGQALGKAIAQFRQAVAGESDPQRATLNSDHDPDKRDK